MSTCFKLHGINIVNMIILFLCVLFSHLILLVAHSTQPVVTYIRIPLMLYHPDDGSHLTYV